MLCHQQLRSYCLVIVGNQDNGNRLCSEVFGTLDQILVRKYSMPGTDFLFNNACVFGSNIVHALKQKSYFLINIQISGFQ